MGCKINSCEIVQYSFHNVIFVTLDSGETKRLGGYFPDELRFEESEFVGLTFEQANQLMRERDIAYLRS